MQSSKIVVLALISVLALAVLATAGNKFGVADLRSINFTGNVRIGDVLLPQGEYEVRHVMEGENHVMVFYKLGAGKPVEARVKCTLAPLPQKADQTQKSYEVNAANEQVLREIVFRGDTAKHVF
jgi:hypothetical protein